MASKKPRILLIEDNGTVRAILTGCLSQDGYEVIETADGMSGLVAAGSCAPDLAVLDLHLPDISGLEIARQIRHRLPFLVLTVDGEAAPVRRCIELGALGYLLKPPDLDDFLRQVRIALERGRETLNLRRAVWETQIISKAIGLLMAHHGLPDDDAHQKLLRFATARKRRVTEVATDLIAAFHYQRRGGRCGSTAPTPPPLKPSADILSLLDKTAPTDAQTA